MQLLVCIVKTGRVFKKVYKEMDICKLNVSQQQFEKSSENT